MNLRAVILICASAGIPLAMLVLALPITWGYGGYNFGRVDTRVYFSDPSGPAYAAGLRVGQRVIANTGNERVQENSGPVGTIVREHVIRANGGVRVISFAFVPFTGTLAVQQELNKFIEALTALGAFILAMLVLLRARNQRVGMRASAVLFFAGAAALSSSGALVCGNAWCAEIFSRSLPQSFYAGAYWFQLSLLAIYPAHRMKLRAALAWFGAAALAQALMVIVAQARVLAIGSAEPLLGAFAYGKIGSILAVLFAVAIAVSIFDAFASARNEDAVPVRWLGAMWLIATAFVVAPAVERLAGGTSLQTHFGDFVYPATVLFTAFGVAYPVLRHRMVDLNMLVSRASVFTIVSMIIVGGFVAAEWGVAKVFEQSFGLSHDKSGLAAQVLTFVIVLVLGMSARSIHRFVEGRLSRAFFRKRLHGLSEIARVAREADAATDAADLMQLGVQTVNHALKPVGVAFYLRRGDRYERCAVAEAANFAAVYRFNDGVPLRLRRWQEAFEENDNSNDRLHMLFVPMCVRGDLVGFLCCGPKPDHTAYLEDEIEALTLLAHHIAIATALLPRTGTPESTVGLTLASS